ncbi:MAG TPA: hypothetical protein VK735_39605 [Pseudonocardia sp.]|uniref:hypothetical protein n=1 Tax=Pseudonocardia sp. TaxID=60912 RepID=UPI002C9A64F6|nr:hypothetical protein [Pseudonocardia sp.]HTF53589.1 hypothetical protein [Pseudonocardia sp.]
MACTSIEAVRSRWLGSGAIPDDGVIATLIDDAEDTILAAVPDLQDRLDDGRIPQARLDKIVARMVIRHVRNPEGYRQIQETTGPFTRGFTHSGDEPGAVFLSSAERRELLGYRSGRAFQIETMPDVPARSYDAERYC